jgi:hypothetical protein
VLCVCSALFYLGHDRVGRFGRIEYCFGFTEPKSRRLDVVTPLFTSIEVKCCIALSMWLMGQCVSV